MQVEGQGQILILGDERAFLPRRRRLPPLAQDTKNAPGYPVIVVVVEGAACLQELKRASVTGIGRTAWIMGRK